MALVAAFALGSAPALTLGAEPPEKSKSLLDRPLQWKEGDHTVTLSLVSRFRMETWDAHASDTDTFYAWRSRAALKYDFQDLFSGLIEFQDARINGLASDTSGAGSLYRPATHDKSRTASQRIRQLWAELRPVEGLALRVGRQDLKLGTEVMYPEGNWKYLKIGRNSQRLVGTVGWTHGERSNDGFSIRYDLGDSVLYGYGAKPTTGVFEIERAYATQDDILHAGLTWTAKRGTLIDNTELRLFGTWYEDTRDSNDGAFGGLDNQTLKIWTTGFSSIGVYPCGSGNLDLTLWGAFQWGKWPAAGSNLDHEAWAAIAEAGYQWTDVRTNPWFRLGVNMASGDGSSTDGDHESFFNVLPTNHLYYGFADRYALGNIIDYFVQLKAKPTEKSGLNLMLHHFTMMTSDDGRHFGTGAYNKASFGYGLQGNPSGHRGMGTELDIIADYKLHDLVALQAGYVYMWGHALFNSMADDDVRFGYLQVTVKY
jgi:hypothetical protein